jgi:UDP-glucose 4-epimerase
LNQPIQNDYSKCKALCESIAAKSNAETLGVRIFAGYGPGEIAKRDYASVITLFLRDMMDGKPPVVFGDGSQKRDFIFITDIIDLILASAETEQGVIEAGSGEPFSFNHIIQVINETIGKNIQPIYQGKPDNYIEETKAGITLGHKFVTLRDGIKHLYQAYKKL